MIRAVLFDLDGTLLDSAPDLVAALNWLRMRHGMHALPVAQVQFAASRGAVGLLEAGMPMADPETLEGWRLEFLSRYEQCSWLDSKLYDGVEEVLAFLADTGLSCGLVTNKPEYLTHPILSAAGIGDRLGSVICGDTLEERKPHPAPVLAACEQLNVLPQESLFVGDDLRDIQAGVAAGVHTCAAMYGYGSAEMLTPENLPLIKGSIVIQKPVDLIAFLSPAEACKQSARVEQEN